MNSPSTGRTPDRPPLRVYLSGDDVSPWRETLISPTALVPYQAAMHAGSCEHGVPEALPYGHTLVGPFYVRTVLEPSDLLPTDGGMGWERTRHLANPERYRMRAIAKADIVFAWLGNLNAFSGMDLELGLAYGTGKAIILAAPTVLDLQRAPLATELAWKMIVAPTPRDAYERVTADLDVTFERGMARIEASYEGRCVVCRSGYKIGDTIYWSKKQGAMHPDCHALVTNPDEVNSVVFNSQLVQALRHENADLERECLGLMTKNSMLEQKLAELTKAEGT